MAVKEYETDEGFGFRLEARLKNAALIGARESLGLTQKEAAGRIGISPLCLNRYENMRAYPTEKKQKQVCSFYRNKGVFLLEEDVFPEELKEFHPRKYLVEKTIPKSKLLSLSEIDRKLLPLAEDEVEKQLEYNEFKEEFGKVISTLSYREQQVIKMRYGFEEESITYCQIGERLKISKERARQLELRALLKLRRRLTSGEYNKNITDFIREKLQSERKYEK